MDCAATGIIQHCCWHWDSLDKTVPPNSTQQSTTGSHGVMQSRHQLIHKSLHQIHSIHLSKIYLQWLVGGVDSMWIPIEVLLPILQLESQAKIYTQIRFRNNKKRCLQQILRFRAHRSRMIMIQVVLQFWHFAEPSGCGFDEMSAGLDQRFMPFSSETDLPTTFFVHAFDTLNSSCEIDVLNANQFMIYK